MAFVPGKPFETSAMKHPSLMYPFESYEENEMFWMQP